MWTTRSLASLALGMILVLCTSRGTWAPYRSRHYWCLFLRISRRSRAFKLGGALPLGMSTGKTEAACLCAARGARLVKPPPVHTPRVPSPHAPYAHTRNRVALPAVRDTKSSRTAVAHPPPYRHRHTWSALGSDRSYRPLKYSLALESDSMPSPPANATCVPFKARTRVVSRDVV